VFWNPEGLEMLLSRNTTSKNIGRDAKAAASKRRRMTTGRLSRLQRRILRYVYDTEAHSGWVVSASHLELTHALGGNKGNVSVSLRNLEAKGLVTVYRTSGGKAEAVSLTEEGKNRAYFFRKF